MNKCRISSSISSSVVTVSAMARHNAVRNPCRRRWAAALEPSVSHGELPAPQLAAFFLIAVPVDVRRELHLEVEAAGLVAFHGAAAGDQLAHQFFA